MSFTRSGEHDLSIGFLMVCCLYSSGREVLAKRDCISTARDSPRNPVANIGGDYHLWSADIGGFHSKINATANLSGSIGYRRLF